MGFSSAEEVLGALVHAYYDERDIEAALSCVTENIEWVGTENNDSAKGKEELRRLLEMDIAAFPDAFGIKLDEPYIQRFGADTVMITVTGKHVAVPGVICGFSIRGTACCVNTESGWLVGNVHVSVPNAELEKYNLEKELDENRKREKTLLAGISGGVAIYRLKKNGTVYTEYTSDGLAKMCGYSTGDEFIAYLQNNAMDNVVEEDAPLLMAAVQESMEKHQPVSIMYRIHVRNSGDILQRLDANIIDSELVEDDLAVWYAVHTIVSDASKEIMREQKQLHDLINDVPAGIGVYEIENGRVLQNYMNNAFYRMLGTTREKRSEYYGENTLSAAHPDDMPFIQAAVDKLLNGESNVSVIYRLKMQNGSWFWVNLTGTVVAREDNYIKIYAVFSNFNGIKQSQKDEADIRQTLSLAMKSAKVLAWKYDCRTNCLTDTLTLGEAFHLPKVMENASQRIMQLGYVAEESLENFRELFRNVSTTAPACADIKALVDYHGGYVWYRIIDTPVYDENGKYTGSIGTALDITEQKSQEQHYEERLRLNEIAAQDSLSKVYVNLSKNLIVSYDHLAPEFEVHKTFATADELLGRVKYDISDPEELKKFDLVADADSAIRAFKNGTTHMEIISHLDVGSQWVKVIYDMLKNPYSGEIEMISSIHDVTDQVRSELVVHKLLDIDYKSIILIDTQTGMGQPFKRDEADDYLEEINEKILQSCKPEQALKLFFYAHALQNKVDTVVHDNSLATIEQALKDAPFYECIYALKEKEAIVQYKVNYSYLENDHHFIVAAVQDVTQLYEEEIRQKNELAIALSKADAANKAKTAFLSRVSHDMRTPLNGILGLTTLLNDNAMDENWYIDINK